ncbi:MAG: methylmalonyl-CoA mutase family protein, partial [Candidatus Bathyarchaeia archaeon]
MGDDLSRIVQERRRWERDILGDKPLPPAETPSGIELKLFYDPEDLKSFKYLDDLGFPGEYPFTRGVQPNMYRGRLWTMRQYSGFATAEETNRRFRYLLDQGQTGLSLAFDLPTQIGYDSDHPLAIGEVGKVGVAVDSLADMETIFNGIPLDKLSTSMTINAPAAILLAMYIAVAEKQGIPAEKLRGTIQNDILKEYTVRGTYIFPVEPSMRLITDIFAYCSKHVPLWNTINISSYHMREAGCDAIQEVAFTFADAIEYVKAGIKAGLDCDSFAPRISWIFNAQSNFFEEIAKFRAARRLWAKIMKERFGAKDPRSMMFRTHVQTGGSTLTAQQPLNNLIRAAFQTLAAVLGGVQSIAVSSYDEGLCIPTEESVTLSLRTQQIIAYETGVADVVDPLAGSYYVESLTNTIEERAMDYIQKIDEMGGAAKAIEMGYIQREIQEGAYRIQREIESEKRIIVGVNRFRVEERRAMEILKVDREMVNKQLENLKRLKKERNNREVRIALQRL